jgi:hypothetical protein
MGCISTRSELTIEEATSYNLDLLLGYSKIPAIKVYKAYLKYSLNGRISNEEFTKISNKLDLFNINTDFVQPILNFFGYFKTDLAHYSLKKLLVFGIIQSKGSTDIKAGLLFDVFCEEGVINAKMIKELFRLIFDLVLKMLTGLKVKDFVNGLTQDDMKLFQAKLTRGTKGCLKEIALAYDKKKNISKEEFIKDSQIAFEEDFFTGHGIRTYLKKHSVGCESCGLDN